MHALASRSQTLDLFPNKPRHSVRLCFTGCGDQTHGAVLLGNTDPEQTVTGCELRPRPDPTHSRTRESLGG